MLAKKKQNWYFIYKMITYLNPINIKKKNNPIQVDDYFMSPIHKNSNFITVKYMHMTMKKNLCKKWPN